MTEPHYLALYNSGELWRRVKALEARLAACDLCPHNCRVNRLQGQVGFCNSGVLPIIARVCEHHGEEPPLSGVHGSGTVFFGNCNMRCVYCQNCQISQNPESLKQKEMTVAALAKQLIHLQDELHCHNINFVSPSHFVPQMVRAVYEAIPLGLKIPLVYNTGGYDSVNTLKLLDGIIDVYLPDLRYADNTIALRYSGVKNYVPAVRAAIKEMHRQVGNLVIDENDTAVRGLIVRHLILPNDLAGSEASLSWLVREISPAVFVSIMAQYYPTHLADQFPEINRRISTEEYERVTALLANLEIDNGWVQDMDAPDSYRPDFERENHPFQP
ncbi:MAG: radical SAM protein [Dehalococcoidales bacterium]|nr:radical SAM protein [Dehalococcoidales bacterium]